VIGTRFDPYAVKAKGNQDLLPWLGAGLRPNPGVDVHLVDHPDGRVVVFEVGPARDQPVSFYGTAWVRVGSSKTEMNKQPEKARALWTRGTDWSAEICERASLSDLDPEAVAKAREQFLVKHPSQAAEVAGWDDVTFLNKAKLLKQGALTNTALLLLGRSEATTLLAPAVAKVSWILKDEDNRELDYRAFRPVIPAGRRPVAEARTQSHRARVAERHPLPAGDHAVRPLGDSRGVSQQSGPPGLPPTRADHRGRVPGSRAGDQCGRLPAGQHQDGDRAGCASGHLSQSVCRTTTSTPPGTSPSASPAESSMSGIPGS